MRSWAGITEVEPQELSLDVDVLRIVEVGEPRMAHDLSGSEAKSGIWRQHRSKKRFHFRACSCRHHQRACRFFCETRLHFFSS